MSCFEKQSVTAIFLMTLLAASVGFSMHAEAATIQVNTSFDEFNAGGNCSLREAIAAAEANADGHGCVGSGAYGDDTIMLVGTGPYMISIPPDGTPDDGQDGDFDIESNISIVGNTRMTIIKGGPSNPGIDRVFD